MASDKALNITLISLGVITLTLGGVLLFRKLRKNRKIDYKPATSDKKLPKNFAEIPGGRNNYRCNQPTLKQFKYIFEKFGRGFQFIFKKNSCKKWSKKHFNHSLRKSYI